VATEVTARDSLTPIQRSVFDRGRDVAHELGRAADQMAMLLDNAAAGEPLDHDKCVAAIEDIEQHYKMLDDAIEATLEVSEGRSMTVAGISLN